MPITIQNLERGEYYVFESRIINALDRMPELAKELQVFGAFLKAETGLEGGLREIIAGEIRTIGEELQKALETVFGSLPSTNVRSGEGIIPGLMEVIGRNSG